MSQRILVVEDNHVNQKVTISLLQQGGFEIDLAEDGLAAIQAFHSQVYDLVVMDCQMPRCDGWEATRAIRRLEATEGKGRHVPIVALTAQALTGDREKCIASGMDDYLTKPVDGKILLQVVRLRLGLCGEGSGVSGQAADSLVATSAGDSEEIMQLDQAVVQNLQLYGAATVAQVYGLMHNDLTVWSAHLKQAIVSSDLNAVAKIAHRMKGGCGTVGLSVLTRAMDHLERQARAGNHAAVTTEWPAYQRLISAAIAVIRPLTESPAT
jgi:CheY-like chemotaxis protein